jgi:hypothetical protein
VDVGEEDRSVRGCLSLLTGDVGLREEEEEGTGCTYWLVRGRESSVQARVGCV